MSEHCFHKQSANLDQNLMVAPHIMLGVLPMKRAALYMTVSSLDQRPESQLYDLQQLASQRGYEVVKQYTDRISGAKARRPALDELLADARRRRFDVVMVGLLPDVACSVKQCLAVLDELNLIRCARQDPLYARKVRRQFLA